MAYNAPPNGGYPGYQQNYPQQPPPGQYQQYPPPQGHSPQPPAQQPYGGPPPAQGYGQQPPYGQQQQGTAQGYYGSPPPQGQQPYGQQPPGQAPYGQQQQQQQGYPPQQQYNQYPPQGQQQYPPNGQQQYPPNGQQQYPPNGQQQYPPNGQQQYPPNGQQQYPPNGQQDHSRNGQLQYGPNGQPYGAYPPAGQQQYPPQGLQGPQHAQQGFAYAAQSQVGYGAPQNGSYGSGPPAVPTPPSLGYDSRVHPNINGQQAAEKCYNAMNHMNTDEKALISALAPLDPLTAVAVRQAYDSRHGDMIKRIEHKTTGHFEKSLCAIVRGPLQQDVWVLQDAMEGMGTDEAVLNDVLLSRSNADLKAIKDAYDVKHRERKLESRLTAELSGETLQLFIMVLHANRREDSVPVNLESVEQDVEALDRAADGPGTRERTICAILSNRNDATLRAISDRYQKRFSRTLEAMIHSEFHFEAHLQSALLHIIRYAKDRVSADAETLHHAMEGAGTKDRLLIQSLTRIHWNKDHMRKVKAMYKSRYGQDLVAKIRSETRGDYENLLVAMVQSA